jgi:UDP-2,4-diacetamido-2,4,6-trideoxy-beta-L-altropyranose hydrolase
MKVAFRVDGSVVIGSGHFVRCLTLAVALRALDAEVHFVCRHITNFMRSQLAELGFRLSVLPPGAETVDSDFSHDAWLGVTQETDARDTVAALAKNAPWDWLVVDNYGLDINWEARMWAVANDILVIDDLANRAHNATALLDQNLQTADRYRDLVPNKTKLMLGPRFALLRPSFRSLRRAEIRPSREKHVNVFFGGTDPKGATLIALDALKQLAVDLEADVIIGADNPHRSAIIARSHIQPNVTLHIQPGNIADLFASALLAVGAGGTSSWERCCVGLPTLICSVADNQLNGAAALAKARAAIDMGPLERLSPAKLSSMLTRLMAKPKLLAAMRRRAHALVDGRGTERVAIYIVRRNLALFPATKQDADFSWGLRNYPSTREFFHDPSPISLDQHRCWWEKSVQSPSRNLLIARCGPQMVGVIRFDYQGKDAIVSIYVDPALTGIGLGKAILDLGSLWLGRYRPDLERQRAEILPENLRSQRCFGVAGYRQIDSQTWIRPIGNV